MYSYVLNNKTHLSASVEDITLVPFSKSYESCKCSPIQHIVAYFNLPIWHYLFRLSTFVRYLYSLFETIATMLTEEKDRCSTSM